MTPLQLNILLHYYSTAADFKGKEGIPQTEWINIMVDLDIFSEDLDRNPQYKITDKGIVYVQGILRAADDLPYPIWMIPTN